MSVKTLRRIGQHHSDSEPDLALSVFEAADGSKIQIRDEVQWTGLTDFINYRGTVIDRRGDLAYVAVFGIPSMFVMGVVNA